MAKKIISISNELSVWFDFKPGDICETKIVGTDFYFQLVRETKDRVRITLQAGEQAKKQLKLS